MNIKELKEKIARGAFDSKFKELYGNDIAAQRQRYLEAADGFIRNFGEAGDVFLLSVPGRSEVGGNHTDHNNGRVLACAVNLDIIAVVSPTGTNTIRIKSKGFELDVVDIREKSPVKSEKVSSSALIRGVAVRLEELGYKIGGFDAYTMSDVLKGSGLSSSAAFEVMTASIISLLFNGGNINPLVMAQAGQYAECNYFGKPCGLMDQTACAVGGFISIDFKDTQKPIIEKLDFNFSETGYAMCIVDTGGNHADLSDDYAAIRSEMTSVAKFLGHNNLRECDEDKFYANLTDIRTKLGDRAALRAIHFFNDNARVLDEAAALKSGNFREFLRLVNESGRSSFMYLQNIYSIKNPRSQGLSLALSLSEKLLKGCGAWRVHGGGFAGTIQAFVPLEKLDEFSAAMENVFGKGACHKLMIRPKGAYFFE
ncbi:galactokinase [[Clostridium] cellulosi]|uniref:Galactokinase n=1 Tax=[Clostridium] cellulosi TaxID=29343 RepID=A0A078KLN5_9FIRM|nr:galactokinase [[Clostridium] cellulosi]